MARSGSLLQVAEIGHYMTEWNPREPPGEVSAIALANVLPEPPLLVITDRLGAGLPVARIVAAAGAAGCRWIMVREKDLTATALAGLVRECQQAVAGTGTLVCVNRDAAVAADCGAGGVHLPQGHEVAAARRRLGREGLVGVSAHSLAEAEIAAAGGADYVTLSPIFPSPGKPGYGPPLGLKELKRVAALVPLPVVALGGIDATTAAACRHAGAAGIAVMGGVMAAPAPTTASLVRALAGLRRSRGSPRFRGD